jgi:putative transposase
MPTDNVSKKRGRANVKISDKREAVMQKVVDSYSEDFDVKISVIQELIPLGLSPEIARSLTTTNCIEALMSQMGSYTDKVDRWHNSNQILRWTGMSLMDIEPRLNRIYGHKYLKVLRFKFQENIAKRLEKEPSGVKIKEVSLV